MKSLLTALQEGRLIELPDHQKEKSLEYLATLIEAIPHVGVEGGITESVMAREQTHDTGIGKGWACPHARSTAPGELLCAVGWSPKGVDYGAPDGDPVHLIVMYFVPDAQKNAYLKEISSLAKAILTVPSMRDLASLEDLGDVRHRLLDAISLALESMAPDARARMIQLDVKQASVQAIETRLPAELASQLFALQIVMAPGMRPVVLAQDKDLVSALEAEAELLATLDQHGRLDCKGYHLIQRSSARFQPDRTVHDCLAVRLEGLSSTGG